MPWPQSMGSILIFVTVAIVGFRAIGFDPGFGGQLDAGEPTARPVGLSSHAVFERRDFSAVACFRRGCWSSHSSFRRLIWWSGIQGMLLRNEGIAANIQPDAGARSYGLCGLVYLLQAFPLGERGEDSRLGQAVAGGGVDCRSWCLASGRCMPAPASRRPRS